MSSQDESPLPIDLPPEPSTGSQPSTGWRSWAIAGAVAVAMVVGGVVVVGQLGGDDSDADAATDTTDQSADTAAETSGADGQGFGGGVSGRLVDVGDEDFVVEGTDRSGETTLTSVTITDDTTFTESQEGDLGSIEVGDNVMITGETGEDGSVSATAIVDSGDQEVELGAGGGAPGGFQPPGDGELPEDFQPPEGFEPPGDGELPEDFQPPEGFEPPGDGELPEDFQPPEGGGPGGFGGGRTIGQVTSVDGSTLTVETADGETVAVTVSSDTEVTVTVVASMDDLQVGDDVQVSGTEEGDAVVADSVRIGAIGGFGPGAGGGAPPTSSESE